MKLDSAAQFVQHWNPLEPKQFFWIDDPFGSVELNPARVDEWNHVLPEIQAAIARGARFVLVSRDYIWHDARARLRRSRLPRLDDSVIDVDAGALSMVEKRQMVYNHLKYGSQPMEFRTAVKPHLSAAAAVDHFLPEVARRFGDPMFTRGLRPEPSPRIGNVPIRRGLTFDRRSITGFFRYPIEHLTEVIEALPDRDKAALAIVYMSGGRLPSPVQLDDNQRAALDLLGGTPANLIQSLRALSGSLLLGPAPSQTTPSGPPAGHWSFKHPTISEAVRRFALSSADYLLIYICGATAYELETHLRCDVATPASAVNVPSVLWPALARRLGTDWTHANGYWAVKSWPITRGLHSCACLWSRTRGPDRPSQMSG